MTCIVELIDDFLVWEQHKQRTGDKARTEEVFAPVTCAFKGANGETAEDDIRAAVSQIKGQVNGPSIVHELTREANREKYGIWGLHAFDPGLRYSDAYIWPDMRYLYVFIDYKKGVQLTFKERWKKTKEEVK